MVCLYKIAKKKLRYLYLLTPAGITAKAQLTASFLKRKLNEYETLKAEIEELRGEVALAGKGR